MNDAAAGTIMYGSDPILPTANIVGTDELVDNLSLNWTDEAAAEYSALLAMSSNLDDSVRDKIRYDLKTSGKSLEADEAMSALEKNLLAAQVEGVATLDASVEQKLEALKLAQETRGVNLLEETMTTLSAPNITDRIFDKIKETTDNQSRLEVAYRRHVDTETINKVGLLNALESVSPFSTQVPMQSLANKLEKQFDFKSPSSLINFTTTGQFHKAISEWIDEQDVDTQMDILEFVVETAPEWSSIMGSNDFIKADTIARLFDKAVYGTTEFESALGRGIDNAASLLDLFMVGGVLRGISRMTAGGGRRASSLNAGADLEVNFAEKTAAQAIVDDSGDVAKSLGATKDDVVVDTLLAKQKGFIGDGNNLIKVDPAVVERNTALLKDLKDRKVDIGVFLDEAEKQAQRDIKLNALENMEGFYFNPLESTFPYKTDTGVEAVGIYYKAKGKGFDAAEIKQAKTRLQQQHPESKVEVLEGGKLKLTVKEDYKAGSNVQFHLDDIFARGAKAKFIGNVATNFSTKLSNAMFVAGDRQMATRASLNKLLEPLLKAKNHNKGMALSIYEKFRSVKADVNKPITIDDILNELPSNIKQSDAEEVVTGIYAMKTATDAAFLMTNRAFRDKQVTAGNRHISYNEFDALAAPVQRESALNIKTAYNPVTDRVEELTRGQVEEIYQNGGQIVKAEADSFGSGELFSRNIIVKDSVEIKELPEVVLNYQEQGVTRLYEDQYFIDKVSTRVIDGVEESYTETLATARNRKEAEAFAQEMGEEGLIVKNSAELLPRQLEDRYNSLRKNSGGLFFGKRGDRLENTRGELADIQDPIASMQRQLMKAAQLQDLNPVIELQKQRFLQAFPEFSKNGYPRSKDVFVGNTVVDETAEKARALWDYIDMMENGSQFRRNWRTTAVRMGEWLEETGLEKVGQKFRTLEGDPISTARGANFLFQIIGNPARQALLNGMQFTFVAGLDPKFVASGAMHRQGGALLLGSLGDSTSSIKSLAKVAGMSTGEYKTFIKAFKDSGLVQSVDSNVLAKDALMELERGHIKGLSGRAIQGGVNAAKKAANITKEAGFGIGERANLANTYSLAWKRYKDKNPDADLTKIEAQTAIAADARQLALGMTEQGKFAYQEGWLSLATQYWSFQHNAFNALARGVPGLSKYGNKAITPQEARRIALFQLMAFGPVAGLGLGGVIDAGLEEAGIVDMPDDVRAALYGGAFDVVANKIIQSSTGQPVDINFAADLAPGMGMPSTLTSTIGDFLSADKSVLEMVVGASASTASRLADVAKTTHYAVFGAEDVSSVEMSDMLSSWASMFSGYRNYLKAEDMLRFGQWVDSNRGLLPLKAEPTEAIVAGLFGITSLEYKQLFDSFQGISSDKRDIEGLVDRAYERVIRLTAEQAEIDDEVLARRSFSIMQNQLKYGNEFLKVMLGEGTPAYYKATKDLQFKLKRQKDAKDKTFADYLQSAVLKNRGVFSDELERAARNKQISQEQYEDTMQFYNNMLGGRNE